MDAGEQCGRDLVALMDARCRGEALDRSLRITINFHPDRACRGAVNRGDGDLGGRVESEHAAQDAGPEDPEHDPLDGYIEAHVHGPVLLARDVEALVLDPSHRGTPVEHAAARLGVPVEWHEGRVLALDVLDQHPEYRGPEPVRLGHCIARGGRIDARTIGDAARTGEHPQRPLKQLWHLVAQWGSPTPA